MTTEEKNRFDAVAALHDAANARFERRRDFEWKIGITLWTALAAFLSLVLTKRIPYSGAGVVVAAVAVALGLFLLHWLFVYGVATRNRLDRDIALFFRDEMLKLASLQFPDHVRCQIKRLEREGSIRRNWAHVFQLGVTLLISLSAVGVVWYAASHPLPSKNGEQPNQALQPTPSSRPD